MVSTSYYCIVLLTTLLFVHAYGIDEIDQETSRTNSHLKREKSKQVGGILGGVVQNVAGPRHRLGLIFPLMLMISSRLATLIPVALSSLFGVGLMVLFAKKALIVSIATLALILYDKWASSKKKELPTPQHTKEIHLYPSEKAPYTYKHNTFQNIRFVKSSPKNEADDHQLLDSYNVNNIPLNWAQNNEVYLNEGA